MVFNCTSVLVCWLNISKLLPPPHPKNKYAKDSNAAAYPNNSSATSSYSDSLKSMLNTLIPQQFDLIPDLLKNLPGYYSNASLQGKRLIIGSIFSGKLIFEKNFYRTTGLDPVFEEICSTSAGSGGNENGTFRFDFEKSHLVPRTGFEPVSPP
jgi:hypothetical protein